MNLFFNLIFIVYIVTTVYLIIKSGGIDLRALDFDSVYEVRGDNKVSGVSGYLLNWSSKVFFPFFTIYFINNKHNLLLAVTIISQLLLYLSYGNKAFLFSVIFLCICYLLVKKDNWIIFFPNLISLSILFSIIFTNYRLGDLVLRTVPYRLLIVPAQIQFWYYEFFRERPKLLYGESFLGSILGTKTSGPSTSLIINKYFTRITVETNANTGIFSDAYSNGGFLAMLVTSLLLLCILLLIDSFRKKIPTAFLVAAFSYSMFILNDTSLLISLNTGGIFFLLVLFYLYSPAKRRKIND